MQLSVDERRIFTKIAERYRKNPDDNKISLQNIAQEFELTQDEFVLAISSLQANTLINPGANFVTATLSKKGLKNINYINP